MINLRTLGLAALVTFSVACGTESPPGPRDKPLPFEPTSAEVIYRGGVIHTMADERPSAAALAVSEGRIAAVGDEATVMKLRNERTRIVDLAGRTLMPGFIDAHGHVAGYAMTLGAVNLSPEPWGRVMSIAQLQDALRKQIADAKVPAGTPVLGFGYDDAVIAERRHPTRQELDAVSKTHPIYVVHVSAHIGVANSLALEQLGFNAKTPNPEGGVIVRDAKTNQLHGRLEENASFVALEKFAPQPASMDEAIAGLQRAEQIWFSYGQTTINEGRASPASFALLEAAADRGALQADYIVQPDFDSMQSRMDEFREKYVVYRNHLRVSAMKLSLDGSPQGKTAWLTQPYFHGPESAAPDYAGVAIYSDEALEANISSVLSHGMTFYAHTNGDAAVDQLIRVVKLLKQKGVYHNDVRPISIHAQTIRADQLDEFAALGIEPSFLVTQVFAWGDWHRSETLGEERAARISPTGTARAKGIPFTLHHDAPVTPPDIPTLVWAGVNRRTRSGFELGPAEKISPLDAFRAVTIEAARQYREGQIKGSLEVGKLADLIILSADPLAIDPMKIREVQVMETIKDGKTVYTRTVN